MSDEKIHSEAANPRKDVNVSVLYKSLLGLGVVIAMVMAGMWAEFAHLNAESKAQDPHLSPLAVQPDQLPPQPRLVTNEPEELSKVRNDEEKILHSYAWVDKSKGIVRIPIEKAMNIVAQNKDLQKAAPAPPAPQTAPTPVKP